MSSLYRKSLILTQLFQKKIQGGYLGFALNTFYAETQNLIQKL